jgi:hypothetical protein
MADQTILQETLDNNIVDGDWLIYWKTSTGVQRRVARSSLLGMTLTGGGTIATGGFTLTVPATGTAALKTGTPVAGNVARWNDANTVQDAEFAASNVALLGGRSGGQSLSGGTAANDDLTLQGTTNATRTTSYVIMQPNGGHVGIGTASPGHRIDVDGGNATQAARFYNSSAATTIIEVGGTGTSSIVDILFTSNSGTAEIWKSGTGGTTYGGVSSLNLYNSNGAIAFHPNNQQNAMFLDTSGRVGIGTTSPSTRLDIDAGALELAEMTAPAAGAANTVRIYAVDNGSGKTQLMAIFSSGAAQQLAIQP